MRKTTVKVVSFDVFDTLVKRLVPPAQLYDCMERKLLQTGSCEWKGFAQKRILAENEIKQKRLYYKLQDIYGSKYFSNVENIQYLIDMERKFELSNVIPNYPAKKIYEDAVGKLPIICISDMYLDSDTIYKMLVKTGYGSITKLYVSCECGAGKKQGDIFGLVCKEQGITAGELMHIGDAIRSDCIIPALKGIQVKYICRTDLLQPTGSYYYDLGYGIFGTAIYEFCRWIHDVKKEETLLFLAREGEFIGQCYRRMFPEEKTSVLYVSRDAVTRGIAYTVLKQEAFQKLLDVMSISRNETVEQLLNRLGIKTEEILNLFHSEGINKKAPIDKKVISFMDAHKNSFMDRLKQYALPFDTYIEAAVGSDNIVVDIGWSGSMQNMLTKYFNLKKSDKKIKGLYLGVNNNRDKQGFLFEEKNKICHQILNFSGLMEVLFMPGYGTVTGYRQIQGGAEPVMAECEFSDASLKNIREFQSGVYAFLDDSRKLGARYRKSKCAKKMIHMGCTPCEKDIRHIENLEVFENGNVFKVVETVKPLHAREFAYKFIDCKWKTAFLRKNLHIAFPYSSIVILMRKAADKKME